MPKSWKEWNSCKKLQKWLRYNPRVRVVNACTPRPRVSSLRARWLTSLNPGEWWAGGSFIWGLWGPQGSFMTSV